MNRPLFSAFQRAHVGRIVTAPSGIVPFAKRAPRVLPIPTRQDVRRPVGPHYAGQVF